MSERGEMMVSRDVFHSARLLYDVFQFRAFVVRGVHRRLVRAFARLFDAFDGRQDDVSVKKQGKKKEEDLGREKSDGRRAKSRGGKMK